jgi:hypothetical protein
VEVAHTKLQIPNELQAPNPNALLPRRSSPALNESGQAWTGCECRRFIVNRSILHRSIILPFIVLLSINRGVASSGPELKAGELKRDKVGFQIAKSEAGL